MKNITFLGDSLTAGYGLKDTASESVPALIQQKIDSEMLDFKVYNGGLSGSTSANGLYRLDHWLRRPIDVFVLELGINDFIRQVPLDTTKSNLEKITRKVLDKNPDCKLIMLGMRLPKHIRHPGANGFSGLFSEIAQQYGMALVPFYLEGVAGKRELNLPDGLHPNAAGYRVIAENIWPVIRQVLAQL